MNKNTDIHSQINKTPLMIAGPCAVESEEQIFSLAAELSEMGVKFLRGGVFKPRTSPKSFQGLGVEGLKYLRAAADKYNMYVVSELMSTTDIESCYDMIDVIQIGSRNMTSYGLLKEIGRKTAVDQKPVLLKRGFTATLNELLLAADYISDAGNPNVILCLRGIRTFEQIDSEFRFTPDLSAIPELKEIQGDRNHKILFDPSHACGDSKYVSKIACAALTLGADGLLVEVHKHPEKALSDGKQSLLPEALKEIINFTCHNK
ncbi:MAG: 3-deoxy-7-phosphoheptulonate synthase [Candidatus Kapabacteria bacterium]|jgi:3-deoxy-7-phosphoheptulonate synthase|nr:3-deoxy-7-phosphoheptulonate synthase [Candidatus Kapabacteria bacterium]